MSRDMAMIISTVMVNLQNTRRCSKIVCDGETFLVEGEQRME
jgi:hypothetical protein